MRTYLSLVLIGLFFSLSAQETLVYPYNPDGNEDGAITVPDLQDLLGTYGNAFTPTEIQIDGVGLLQVIQDLQDQIAAIQLLDANYVESTLAVHQQEIATLYQQIAENALPDGTTSGQLLRWNGTAWTPVSPILVGCSDDTACNYNPAAIGDDGSCTVNDECGVCGGDNSSCTDACGVVNGDNSSCTDACGVVNGDNSCLDECGVLNGDGSSCVFESCGDQIGHENYAYSTVLIGEQCWFSENCRYLPEVSPSIENSDTEPYYYVYGYEDSHVFVAQATTNYETYGVLYNRPAVMAEGICPTGWHIPSDGEFTELTDFLGGESVAGVKMKDDVLWNGTNSSGWTGLPGGYGNISNGFQSIGIQGYWWSASGSGSHSWSRLMRSGFDSVSRNYISRGYGFSARCVRD